MMDGISNLFDYLIWRGDLSFEKDEFNEIDGMILSRFSYAPLEYVFDSEKEISIENACKKLLSLDNIKDIVLDNDDPRLFELFMKSKRFSNLTIFNYINHIDEKEETQFSALTIRLTKKVIGIVYRGTDNTLIGWKENLNMGFISPIACQSYGLNYLLNLSENFPKDDFILAGHSKGGNVASFAGIFAPKNIQDRIIGIFNYDGPGFVDKVLNETGYKNISEKIFTYVPQASLVGMLLGHKEEHQIVHSSEVVGPFQHNIYSWDVIGKKFIAVDEMTQGSKYFDETFKNWLSNMNTKQREEFVEASYSLVADVDAKTLEEMKKNWWSSLKSVSSAMKNMDDVTKQTVSDGIKLFMKSVKETLK